MSLWVDTDYGFDDLWALLLLRHAKCAVAGISLVAGNATLDRVIANAQGAALAYGIDAPLYAGAATPLRRDQETAERILGPQGMTSRGRFLPRSNDAPPPRDGVAALAQWLMAPTATRQVLALGPLTNIALLVQRFPQAAARITRLVWMGGSNGPGNHSAMAEFNALADPEALDQVVRAAVPLDIVDLSFCRQVRFGPADMPICDPLTADLLGGYLDIGLSRGRDGMAIYDPLAALAITAPQLMRFERYRMKVSLRVDDSYGATTFLADPAGPVRLATLPSPICARSCLDALRTEKHHGLSH
ncbi:hypothetical protein BFP70_18010 [Thioclava sp. SK-1]|uniref:nucleoside hydrolase n=1 Tax=Thioclava sp. SK-1 TaxID=1889770 RepID=UPI000825C700|nr:nucleoside hydrolase [Thioclava sp. SK-1]OCX59993.1 hypothetical protein BFP70_18010 [Thioclava sp. SK-1]